MKFNIGDRVEYVRDFSYSSKAAIGMRGTINDINEELGYILVVLDRFPNDEFDFEEGELELV